MELDPFRPADNWTDCPRCDSGLSWNNEDGLEGQWCSCGYVFKDSDAPELEAVASMAPGLPVPRRRPSGLAERALEGAPC